MTSSLVILYNEITTIAFGDWMARLLPYVLGLLYTTSIIAFAIGCKDLSLSGGLQMEGMVALFVRVAFLTGMMSWFLSSEDFLLMIPNSLEELGSFITGQQLTFGTLTSSFNKIVNPLLAYYQTLSWTSPGLLITCCVLVFFIYCLSTLFVVTVLLVKLETVFIIVGGVFSAAFFVIGYFRDIFMGFIKALIMNGVKLLLLNLCLGLLIKLMEGWGAEMQAALVKDSGLYDTVIPMAFGLMAFYIIIKTVPQYAVAIMSGHASADGSMAGASVMAAWHTAKNVTNATTGTASSIKKAANAYSSKSNSVRNAGGSNAKARGMGALSAVGALIASPYTTGSGGGNRGSGGGNSGGGNAPKNETQPGGAADPFKTRDSYNKEMGK